MDYIEKTLGIKIRRSNWEHETKIPLFLKNEYSLQKLLIDQIVCMSITPYDELPPIGTLKKHINQLQNLSSCPVVLELNGISRQRRGTLIDERIPFVVTDKQLYLPFLGVHLTEQFTPDKKNITGETLLPSAQMLLFYFILGKNRPLPLQDATKRLGFSAMTISRAAAQLVELGFLEKKATGVQKTLSSAYTPKQLFSKAQEQLIHPVKKTVYIKKDLIEPEMFPAGQSALAEISMINPPVIQTYGYVGRLDWLDFDEQLIDTDNQCKLELWKYDPRKISGDHYIDVLSLAMSLSDEQDERIEQCIEDMLQKVWE